jgi:hypothetical protein
VRVICNIHVVPGGRDVPFQSSVTIWQASKRKQSDWKKGGWNATLSSAGWYEAVQLALEPYGYVGKWQASPWGRFGDFWKMLKGADSAMAEVEVLDEILRQSWRGARAASATRRRKSRAMT